MHKQREKEKIQQQKQLEQQQRERERQKTATSLSIITASTKENSSKKLSSAMPKKTTPLATTKPWAPTTIKPTIITKESTNSTLTQNGKPPSQAPVRLLDKKMTSKTASKSNVSASMQRSDNTLPSTQPRRTGKIRAKTPADANTTATTTFATIATTSASKLTAASSTVVPPKTTKTSYLLHDHSNVHTNSNNYTSYNNHLLLSSSSNNTPSSIVAAQSPPPPSPPLSFNFYNWNTTATRTTPIVHNAAFTGNDDDDANNNSKNYYSNHYYYASNNSSIYNNNNNNFEWWDDSNNANTGTNCWNRNGIGVAGDSHTENIGVNNIENWSLQHDNNNYDYDHYNYNYNYIPQNMITATMVQEQQSRRKEQSILTDFFLEQEQANAIREQCRITMNSSTAASIGTLFSEESMVIDDEKNDNVEVEAEEGEDDHRDHLGKHSGNIPSSLLLSSPSIKAATTITTIDVPPVSIYSDQIVVAGDMGIKAHDIIEVQETSSTPPSPELSSINVVSFSSSQKESNNNHQDQENQQQSESKQLLSLATNISCEVVEHPSSHSITSNISNKTETTRHVDPSSSSSTPAPTLVTMALPVLQALADAHSKATEAEGHLSETDGAVNVIVEKEIFDSRSLSPEAPETPSPRLSPILVSLADLRDIRREDVVEGGVLASAESRHHGNGKAAAASLPSSPVDPSRRMLVPSWSREDLRISQADQTQLAGTSTEDGEGQRCHPPHVARQSPILPSTNIGSGVTAKASNAIKQQQKQKHPQSAISQSVAAPTGTRSPDGVWRPHHHTGATVTAGAIHTANSNSSRSGVFHTATERKTTAPVMPTYRIQQQDRNMHGQNHNNGEQLCARSETGIEGREDYQQWGHDSSRRVTQHNSNAEEIDNYTISKDGSTTITSAMSHRESEDVSVLREERNTFRDMCLTLGAEVAKLKNLLAAQAGAAASSLHPATAAAVYSAHQGFSSGNPTHHYPVFSPGFDPECMMPPYFQHNLSNGEAFAAMSDVGFHRGEYGSQMSEDDAMVTVSNNNKGNTTNDNNARRLSSGATLSGSDISLEHTSTSHNNTALQGGGSGPVAVGLSVPVVNRDGRYDAVMTGLQSRLSKDIFRFLDSISLQLKKHKSNIALAVERITRLVNTVWPRAQVKLYGSHVSGLCLPSSDLDFVICLPAVHKNAPADAPGVLEGRNAINETSQKLLARKLKSESWIDPRSMVLIERTVVPVIKVSTKNTRACTLQLDISFDSPQHHGLEAVEMVTQIMEELPMIRPLVLVLKQFLLDRGLLTAYTGGLSSYCLFLMVAKYLQEQPSSWGDCGSLLMGFLDYYGNCFDPRTTGISVGRRMYFARPNYAAARRQAAAGQQMWANVPPSPVSAAGPASTGGGNTEFFSRRKSFSDKGNTESARGVSSASSSTAASSRPPRFHQSPAAAGAGRYVVPVPPSASRHSANPVKPQQRQQQQQQQGQEMSAFDHGIMPFTFDPLFVDDPLSTGNNVGRNAFRIFQVQRAFSDAHRALVASLEWDIQSAGDLNDGVDYPLLKCLLQSEDVLYEL